MKIANVNKIKFVKKMLNYLHLIKSKEKSLELGSKTILPDEILNYISTYQVPEQTTKEQTWNNILARIENTDKKVQISFPKQKKILVYYSVAASVLLIFGISVFLLMNQKTTIKTSNGQIITYILPDSSIVKLNSESTISYHTFCWTKRRIIDMEGEVFFEIKKGGKFEVITKTGTVTVYGTSFNVLKRENMLKVSCYTGKVGVKLFNAATEVILLPGYETSTEEGNKLLPLNTFDKQETAAWQTGEFYFSNVSLNLVFDELARQYNIEVKYPSISKRHYTGSFNNKNLEQALDMICIPMQLQYTITNENIVIISTIK